MVVAVEFLVVETMASAVQSVLFVVIGLVFVVVRMPAGTGWVSVVVELAVVVVETGWVSVVVQFAAVVAGTCLLQ